MVRDVLIKPPTQNKFHYKHIYYWNGNCFNTDSVILKLFLTLTISFLEKSTSISTIELGKEISISLRVPVTKPFDSLTSSGSRNRFIEAFQLFVLCLLLLMFTDSFLVKAYRVLGNTL